MIQLLLFIALIVLELGYFKLASYYKISDKPNERSSHHQATLLGGGVIFIFSVLLYFFAFGMHNGWFVTAALLLSVVSYIDDLKPLTPKLRLLVQFSSVLLMFADLSVYNFPVWLIVLMLIVSTGVMNATNFMDGINGMLGMMSMVVLGSLLYINLFVVHFTDSNLIILLLMSVVIFNFFNFRIRAVCFAGDVGSFTIGISLVFLISKLIIATGNLAWIGMLAVFGVDTLLTIVHRIILGENLTLPHRKHVFQLLANELQWSHLFTSAVYAVLQLAVIAGLIIFQSRAYLFAGLSVIVLSVLYLIIKQKYYYLHQQKTA